MKTRTELITELEEARERFLDANMREHDAAWKLRVAQEERNDAQANLIRLENEVATAILFALPE